MAEEKLMTIECDIPKTHLPGQKVVWVSPITGLKVALNVPETANPGQTLTFQLPERIVTPVLASPEVPASPAADEPAPAEPKEKLLRSSSRRHTGLGRSSSGSRQSARRWR